LSSEGVREPLGVSLPQKHSIRNLGQRKGVATPWPQIAQNRGHLFRARSRLTDQNHVGPVRKCVDTGSKVWPYSGPKSWPRSPRACEAEMGHVHRTGTASVSRAAVLGANPQRAIASMRAQRRTLRLRGRPLDRPGSGHRTRVGRQGANPGGAQEQPRAAPAHCQPIYNETCLEACSATGTLVSAVGGAKQSQGDLAQRRP
jgi:hypothetical protein